MNKEFNLGDYNIKDMFVGSDYHYNHDNVIKFDQRPYNNVKLMNEDLIKQHNSITDDKSLTFLIGDIAMGKSVSEVVSYLHRMNGKKILIKGNHDFGFLKDSSFRNCFELIENYYAPSIEGTKVVMFHYPIWEWDKIHRGAIHLHGHTHKNIMPIPGKILNVGIMNNNYIPFRMTDIFKRMEHKPIRNHHGD